VTAGEQPDLPPLSLYVHLPWCVRKCPYCDFNSHTAGEKAPQERYLSALEYDLRMEAASGKAAGRLLQTVFIGGGTPSLFSAAQIARLLQTVQREFGLANDVEVTMEANPGTVEYDNLAGYRAAGVTRLSIGAQSFNEKSLQSLGRIHGPPEIVAAYRGAQAAGFDSINLDLMFALPGQDLAMAAADVRQAIELSPGHISFYQLTLEPNTVFFSRPPADIPNEDNAWEMQTMGHGLLQEAGYEYYEISAFARDGHRCRHNLNYWTFGDYLAVGAGAHGKYSGSDGLIHRYVKPLHPTSYIEQAEAAALVDEDRVLSEADICFEYMLNALRLPDGFSEADFEARTGLPFESIAAGAQRAKDKHMLEKSKSGIWQPTELGMRFLNDLQASFLRAD
jgi:putative oxygen-independent coproporphyrinogen III oxidase